jgi:nucleoside diphosphate kinase
VHNSPFLFGAATKSGFVDLFAVVRKLARDCGATDPESLRSRPIRRTFATTLGECLVKICCSVSSVKNHPKQAFKFKGRN